MKSKHFWIVFAFAAALRLAGLGAAQYWYDEAFTAWVTRLPFPKMMAAISGDVHPPLWYVIEWVMQHGLGGHTEGALRIVSLMLSLAGLWLTWRMAQDLYWPAAAQVIAVTFMAVNPLQLFFAQEARMYALLQAEILLGVVAILEWRWWLAGIAILASLYTHNYGLIYWPVLLLISVDEIYGLSWIRIKNQFQFLFKWPRLALANKYRPLLALTLPLLAWLPWAGVLSGQMRTVAGGYWIQQVSLGDVIESIYILVFGLSMTRQVFIQAMLVTFGLISLVAWRVYRSQPPTGAKPLVILAVGPLLLSLAVSYAWKPIFLFRGLIASAPAFYLLAAWAIARLPRLYRLYAAVLVLPVVLTGVLANYLYSPKGTDEYRSVVEEVREEWQPGDIILHASSGTLPGWEAYAPDLPQYRAEPCDDWDARGGLSESTLDGLDVPELSLDRLGDYGRVWLVWSEGPLANACIRAMIGPLVDSAQPVEIIQDNDYVYSGVWLYEQR